MNFQRVSGVKDNNIKLHDLFFYIYNDWIRLKHIISQVATVIYVYNALSYAYKLTVSSMSV